MTEAPDARGGADQRAALLHLVEVWHVACADFVALTRRLAPEQGELPTDLAGWTVKDNVAHTAHLEAVLAGAPEETLQVDAAPHLTGPMSYYTEQGVLARRDRDLGSLADELETAVATRYAALRDDPPVDGSHPAARTPGGIPWDTRTLLTNRPVDVWMHEQDIRRAIGEPGGFASPAAAHAMGVFGRALPMVVGKRVAPPAGTSIRVAVPDAGLEWTVRVGDDGRAGVVPADSPATGTPTTSVTLTPEDFVVLAGGRRPPESTRPSVEGDEDLGRALLKAMVVTP